MTTLAGTAPLTHSATLRRLLYEALAELGHDPATIYRRTNQNRRLVPPPMEGRLSHDEAPLFWLAADALTGDPDIGLHLGEVMKPRLLDVVGYLLLASRDLEQALRSFLQFQHILAGGFVAQLRIEGERVCLVLDLNYRGFGPLRQQMECLVLLFIKLLRLITDDDFQIDGLDLRHVRPVRIGEHLRLFGLQPNFAAEHDALWFPAALLRRPSRNANPELHRVLWQHAEQQLAELVENDLLNRLSYLLEMRLGRADCSLQACAAELAMAPAALQRGLAAQGSHLRQVREAIQQARAHALLQGGQAIREVARACGFAELSPFYRAFRRWYGIAPDAYRAKLLLEKGE
ncbi:AraC family transcriptional regulator [Pseudomonas sp. Gutcm_11s]|uniref:AraC family transcriptional regulator n=1 Tax=Pseudomonas sp. Gutcm_11s TaxID=3026088 RepID=UPI002362625B|nr:AraC family transcriptional regulator [Pseudomonas sp. Gutcm_11s]MDD0845077.1 AraC family transcriptional regulator ligand-binding domain-containing protein [Pseudomonas sp. Gutcm_11s]